MKFCLSSRQTPEYLSLADEIRILSRDINQIYDLADTYPEKSFVYNLESLDGVRDTLDDLAVYCHGHLTLALYNLNDISYCASKNFQYFYVRPAKSLSEVRALKALGVSQVLIDEPLTHMLHKVKVIGVPIRMIPVYAFLDGIPRDDGVCGNWFRPEDIDAYSIYVDTVEFGAQPQKREQALYRIYAQDKEWPGNLGRLVTDLNYLGVNRMLNPQDTMRRMNCGMVCAEGQCRICYHLLDVASEEKLRDPVSEIHRDQPRESTRRENRIPSNNEGE